MLINVHHFFFFFFFIHTCTSLRPEIFFLLTGSVDDHFARALGDQMWTEIKARTEPQPLDSLSGSVDAHFAKALGAAMWKKLKAENKRVDDVISTSQQQVHAQQKDEQAGAQNSSPPSPLQTSIVTWKCYLLLYYKDVRICKEVHGECTECMSRFIPDCQRHLNRKPSFQKIFYVVWSQMCWGCERYGIL